MQGTKNYKPTDEQQEGWRNTGTSQCIVRKDGGITMTYTELIQKLIIITGGNDLVYQPAYEVGMERLQETLKNLEEDGEFEKHKTKSETNRRKWKHFQLNRVGAKEC